MREMNHVRYMEEKDPGVSEQLRMLYKNQIVWKIFGSLHTVVSQRLTEHLEGFKTPFPPTHSSQHLVC